MQDRRHRERATSRPAAQRPASDRTVDLDADLASFGRPSARIASDSSGHILDLQRAIGNRAVRSLIEPARPLIPTVQRKLASYEEFVAGARKVLPRGKDLYTQDAGGEKGKADPLSIFRAGAGEKALDALRKHYLGAENDDVLRAFGKADILSAYRKYSADTSIDSLNDLYDTITYWEALNEANSTAKWYPSAIYYLSMVKDSILHEIQQETEQKFGTKVEIDKHKEMAETRRKKDQHFHAVMPEYMKKIGIAPRYYEKNLFGHPERLSGLNDFYVALQQGRLKDAVDAY